MTLYKVCVALLWGASLQAGLGDWGEVPEGSVRFRKVPAPPQALPSLSAPWGASGAPAEERALWASGCGVLWMPDMDPLAALQRRWWVWWGEEGKERPWGAGHNQHFQPCAAGGGAGNEGVKSNLGRRGVVEVFSVSWFFFFLLSGSISIGHNVLLPTWNLLCVWQWLMSVLPDFSLTLELCHRIFFLSCWGQRAK